MKTILKTNVEARASVWEFKSSFALFYSGSEKPYAMRAPLDSVPAYGRFADGEPLFDEEGLRISANGSNIYCNFGSNCRHSAVIALATGESVKETARFVQEYFRLAEQVLSDINLTSGNQQVNELIQRTADFCGCLTDINPAQKDYSVLAVRADRDLAKSNSLTLALITVCLIFRRISALRGFNFKLISNGDLPGLALSAKILGNGIESIKDLPEYTALDALDSGGGVTIYSRMTKLPDDDESELRRLVWVLTPHAEDPQGILRAPEWKAKTISDLDRLDLEIPGRF